MMYPAISSLWPLHSGFLQHGDQLLQCSAWSGSMPWPCCGECSNISCGKMLLPGWPGRKQMDLFENGTCPERLPFLVEHWWTLRLSIGFVTCLFFGSIQDVKDANKESDGLISWYLTWCVFICMMSRYQMISKRSAIQDIIQMTWIAW